MSSCPAYLGLTIFDLSSAEIEGQRSSVIVQSDLLIFCPSNFTITVRLGTSSSDAVTSWSIVVRLADSVGLPFDVRLTRFRSNDTGQRVHHDTNVGAHQRSSPTPRASKPAERQLTDFTDGNILIAIAITGVLLIVVYVGQNTSRANTGPLRSYLLTLTK